MSRFFLFQTMNYLAHILLSGENADIQVGNFMGDAVKGRRFEDYQLNLKKGILLHRQIDSFTDQHQIVKQSKQRLHPRYNHYKGVIIDIFYDHFLAKNWTSYSSVPLDEFIQDFYKYLEARFEFLPEKILWMAPKLIASNWFSKYDNLKGITRVFTGMENRIKHDIPLHKAIEDLKEHNELFEGDFKEFFPEIQAHAADTLAILQKQFN